VTPAKAGVQTSSLRKQGTILRTGFLFSQETLDSGFRRNDEFYRISTFYEIIKFSSEKTLHKKPYMILSLPLRSLRALREKSISSLFL